MTAPVIAGYDGTPESRDALALTSLLAASLDAPVVVLSVVTAAPLEIDWRTYLSDLDEQAERLKTEAREMLAGLAEVETIAVPAPSPPRELHRLADERDARAVVLGSTHRGALGKVLPGTVADRLLAGGTCPVAVAPRGFSDRDARLKSIGVGLDGSAEARAAALAASQLAHATGASLTLVCVCDPRDPGQVAESALGWSGLVAPQMLTRRRLDELWAMARAVVREMPVEVGATIAVVEGDAAEELSELSDRFDLLVLGSRGYGPLGRVLAGSVSAAVLRAARCPVLVTPRPLDGPEATAPPSAIPDDLSLSLSHAGAND